MSQNSRMLDYFKIILTRVSFDAHLFEKELRKAIRALIGKELADLRHWCYQTFSGLYDAVLNNCFGK